MTGQFTDFGFQRIPAADKTARVNEVFSSVASRYDVMNDLMSVGMHRLWKRAFVHLMQLREGMNILDVAGGTGDISYRIMRALGRGDVIACDLNFEMLECGRDRLLNRGVPGDIAFVQGNAEALPFPTAAFDRISIAFGLRNVNDKLQALQSMFRCVRYGGSAHVLEFSKPVLPILQKLYDSYSFHVIPGLGELITGDRESYQYLVESIRVHPDQDALACLMQQAGFERVRYHNLSAGIVAIHIGYKI